MSEPSADDELGAHVSTRGGVHNAPARAREIDAASLQLFTKQPNRWAEPTLDASTVEAFLAAREEHDIRTAGAHDSYLINLSSPDPGLWRRSVGCFTGELRRCTVLGLDFLVTHPGNATDGDVERGIATNARGIIEALDQVGEGATRVLLELTAGSGTSVGGSFERLAAILDALPADHRARVGVCVDTCHAWAAGYDLAGDYEGVWEAFDRVLGRDRLGLDPPERLEAPQGVAQGPTRDARRRNAGARAVPAHHAGRATGGRSQDPGDAQRPGSGRGGPGEPRVPEGVPEEAAGGPRVPRP